mmetsp:Transcript_16971/g.22744  ORF Transcript_16971/g.22744 Transcript_16971/m.22744 type:complete len:329 (+) Transcript_16971:607-1593(+)
MNTIVGNKRGRSSFSDLNGSNETHVHAKKNRTESSEMNASDGEYPTESVRPGFLPAELCRDMEQKLLNEYDSVARRNSSHSIEFARRNSGHSLASRRNSGHSLESRRNSGQSFDGYIRSPPLVHSTSFPPPGVLLPRTSFKADISGFGDQNMTRGRSSRFSLTMSKLFAGKILHTDDDLGEAVPDRQLSADVIPADGDDERKGRRLSLLEYDYDIESEQLQRLRTLPPTNHLPLQHISAPTVEQAPLFKRGMSDFFANRRASSLLGSISVSGNSDHGEIAEEEILDDAFRSLSERANIRKKENSATTDNFDYALATENRWSISSESHT